MKSRVLLLVTVITLLFALMSTSTFAEDAKVYRKSETGSKKIALTFDDGPHPRLTPKILSVLREYDVKATFFVIGENAQWYSEAMRLLADSPHEIGNHTFSHRRLLGLSEDETLSEITSCKDILSNDFGIEVSLLRPPQGKLDKSLEERAGQMGYDIILWNIDTKDWAHTSAGEIASKVLGEVSGGDIILMHDYISGYSPTCDALRLIIPELLERGYEFVTVSELIRDEI